jgi:hypothetical protein
MCDCLRCQGGDAGAATVLQCTSDVLVQSGTKVASIGAPIPHFAIIAFIASSSMASAIHTPCIDICIWYDHESDDTFAAVFRQSAA